MAINMTDLAASLKDHVTDERVPILEKIVQTDLDFLPAVTSLDEVSDEIDLVEFFVNSILQPGNKDTFDSKANSFGFKSRKGKVRPCKIDLQLTPKQVNSLHKSWVGKTKRSTPSDVYDLPFEAEIMQGIIKRTQNDLRKKAAFKGVYDEDGTSALDTMDGYLTIRQKLVTAGKIPAGNVFMGAAFTDSNTVDQFNGVADLVDSEYDDEDLIALCSRNAYKKYCRAYKMENSALPYNTGFEKTYIEGTDIEIFPVSGITGDEIMITPRGNLFWLTDSIENASNITVEKSKRFIYMMMDFQAAPEIGIPELVYTNNQGLVLP